MILKGNITIKYTSIQISELQCFNSFTKCWKTTSSKSFGLSVEIWGRFYRLVCFNWVRNKVSMSFILEKSFWIHDKLDILMHEKNILWEVKTPKYTVYKKKIYNSRYMILMYFVIKFFWVIFITHAYKNNI